MPLKVGDTNLNNQGLLMKIIEYSNANNIIVEFEDGYIIKTWAQSFRNGKVKNKNFKDVRFIDRTGEEKVNNQGVKMKIIRYDCALDIDVEFEDGYIAKNETYSNFKLGEICSYLNPDLYGVGIFGVGKYKSRIGGEKTKEYKKWNSMIQRCYSEKFQIKHPNYIGCSVCEEWHNFQNFAKWYEENLWSEDCSYLDKDILVKGNKIYSPSNCVLVDNRLNCLFTKSDKARGELPIGVSFHKRDKIFEVSCSTAENRNVYLGRYDNKNDAFVSYKNFKESYIKQVAKEYKSKYKDFPKNLFESMTNYKVEVND